MKKDKTTGNHHDSTGIAIPLCILCYAVIGGDGTDFYCGECNLGNRCDEEDAIADTSDDIPDIPF